MKLSFVDYDELIDRFIHAIFNTNNQLIVVIVVWTCKMLSIAVITSIGVANFICISSFFYSYSPVYFLVSNFLFILFHCRIMSLLGYSSITLNQICFRKLHFLHKMDYLCRFLFSHDVYKIFIDLEYNLTLLIIFQ